MEKVITNYDHCLRFQVLDKRISFIDGSAAEVVADNRGCICVHIEFDDQWDGIAKVARFIYNGEWKDCVLDNDGDCYCPSEVIKKGRFSVGVYGADLKTTTPITVTVVGSILSDSKEELPDDPTPGIYEQILQQYNVAIEEADKATQAAWEAISTTEEAIKALNQAKEELEDGGFVASIKEINHQKQFKVWVGTKEEYNDLSDELKHIECCLYFFTDDDSEDFIIQQIEKLNRVVEEVNALADNEGKMTLIYDYKQNGGKTFCEGDEIEPLTTQVFPLYYITIWSGSSAIIAAGTFWQNEDRTQTAHAIRGSGNWIDANRTCEIFVNMKYSYQTKKLKLDRLCSLTHDITSGKFYMGEGQAIAEIYGFGKF